MAEVACRRKDGSCRSPDAKKCEDDEEEEEDAEDCTRASEEADESREVAGSHRTAWAKLTFNVPRPGETHAQRHITPQAPCFCSSMRGKQYHAGRFEWWRRGRRRGWARRRKSTCSCQETAAGWACGCCGGCFLGLSCVALAASARVRTPHAFAASCAPHHGRHTHARQIEAR